MDSNFLQGKNPKTAIQKTAFQKPRRWVLTSFAILSLCGALVSTSGCTNLLRTLVVLTHDPNVKPEYDIVKKRVALVTTVDGISTKDASALVMSSGFKALIKSELKKKVVFIDQEEVDRAFNDQPLESKNFAEIASQTGADCVIFVDIKDLKLKRDKTLYQGSCQCAVKVYEPDAGKSSVYQEEINDLVHPSGGKPITECTEVQFRGHYLSLLARRASRLFYKWDPNEDYAQDAAAASL